MPKFLDTRGRQHIAISICDRCKLKFPYDDLYPDPNSPGLRVCKKDLDELDPYKLKPRQPEKISLRYPRPDSDISTVGVTNPEDVSSSPPSVILPSGGPAPTPTPVIIVPPVVLPDVTPLPPVVLPPTPVPPPVYVPPPGSTPSPIPTPGPTPVPSPDPGPSPAPNPTPTPTPTTADPKPTLSSALIEQFVGDMCFREDFNGSDLNGSYWNLTMPGEFEGQSLTSYMNPNFSQKNWEVINSMLRVWPAVYNDSFYRKTFSTAGKFLLKNGVWEAKIRLNKGLGVWPLFWLYNSDSVSSGSTHPEIDVMEAFPGAGNTSGWGTEALEPNNYSFSVWDSQTSGGIPTNLATRRLNDYYGTERLDTSFHTYTVKVEAGKIRTWFDGKELGAEVTTGKMDFRYFPIISLWFGSASSGPAVAGTPTGPGNAMEIEYLYAWKLKNGSSVISGTGPAYVPNSTPTPTPTPDPTPTPTGIWPYGRSVEDFQGIVFNDEFSGSSLDTTYWTNTHSNFDVNGGTLRQWPVSPFVASSVHTKTKFTRQYGYFEFNFKAPTGDGVQPVFGIGNEQYFLYFNMLCGAPAAGWSNGSDQPIDFSTIVYNNTNGTTLLSERQSNHLGGAILSAAAHKYAIEYTSSRIRFFWDGVEVASYSHAGAITGPMAMFVDLQYSTVETSPGGGTTTGSGNSQTLDYARVWSLASTASTPGTGTGPTPSTGVPNHIVEYHGTSFVYGYDGAAGGGRVAFPSPTYLASRYPNITVRNEGVNSSSIVKLLNGTDGVHTTFASHVAASDANLFILSFGFSEVYDYTVAQYRTYLQQALDIIKNNNRKAMLISIHKVSPVMGDQFDEFRDAMQAEALENNVPFIDMLAYTEQQFTGNILDWVPDNYHPNQNGYSVIGVRVADLYATLYQQYFGGVGVTPTPTPGVGPVGLNATDWTLTFEDHFTGVALDNTKWTATGGPRVLNSTPGTYKIEDSNLVMCYQNPFQRGNCTIITDPSGNGISGGFQQTYGFFEARIKCPKGQNAFPAFWLFRNDEREIDIMECFGGQPPGQTWLTSDYRPINASWSIHKSSTDTGLASGKLSDGCYQANDFPGEFNWSWLGTGVLDLSADYHTYGCWWDANSIRFYFDGKPWPYPSGTAYTARASEFNAAMYMLLDFWMEGSGPGSMPVGFGSHEMRVDYVRAWRYTPGAGGTTPTPTPTPTTGGQPQVYPFGQNPNLYTLPTFWDEFEGTSLDRSKWNDIIWYNPPDEVSAAINYKVSNGSLKIWPLSPYKNRTIDTDGKFTQLYGYFEIEAKLCRGRGVWPAFWLFAHPGSLRPEIDIMEAWPGGGPSTGWGTSDLRPDTFAFTAWSDTITRIGGSKLRDYLGAQLLDNTFHIYGLKWESNGVTMYFDGQQLGPKILYSYTHPMYIMLDLWYGGPSGTPNTSETPQGETNSFEIKYVRAWQFK